MRFLVFAATLLWLSAAVGGAVYLNRFSRTPSAAGDGHPGVFPSASRLARETSSASLLFFAHPKCPCTRASLRELARLMTDVDGHLRAHVIFIKPANALPDWAETDLRSIAEGIPNVNVVIDENEAETHLFDARTSGTALLYDREGNLRYNGGITSARGHEGDNAGRNAIRAIVMSETTATTAEGPVFGCPLHEANCTGRPIDPAH